MDFQLLEVIVFQIPPSGIKHESLDRVSQSAESKNHKSQRVRTVKH